jgi:hypothetical protein
MCYRVIRTISLGCFFARRSYFTFFSAAFFATPLQVFLSSLFLSSLTEANLSQLPSFPIERLPLLVSRQRQGGQVVGESRPYVGGSAPDDLLSALQIVHEAVRDAKLLCEHSGS